MSGDTVVCGRECWVSSLQFAMSDRDYRGHRTATKIRHSANSSRDPDVSATRSASSRSSNARTHPKADSYGSYHSLQYNSHHGNHQSASERRGQVEEVAGQDVWTEHMSSKGRVYFYNQRTEKSQWTKPASGSAKRLKENVDDSEAGGKESVCTAGQGRPTGSQGSQPGSEELEAHMDISAAEDCDGRPEGRGPDSAANHGSVELDGRPSVDGRGRSAGGGARAVPQSSVSESSSSCSTPTRLASPAATQPSAADGDSRLQLPPLAQGLHPLQQALLLQQSVFMRTTVKDTTSTSPDDIGDVSMEISSSSPSPSPSPVHWKPASCSHPSLPTTAPAPALPGTEQPLGSPLPAPEPLLPRAGAEKGGGGLTPSGLSNPSPDHTPLLVSITGESPLFRSSLTYNAIADLPVELREPLPHPAIQVDSFQPNLTEFWYTPANEMMEKQIHQSANEFIFKTVSMTHRLDSHLTKLDVTLQRSSVHLCAQQSRLQSLKTIAKDIVDLK